VRRRQASTSYQYVVTIEAVKRLLMTYALCFPSISFTLTDGTRNSRLLTIRKSLTSLEIFRQLAGQEIAKYTELLDMYEDNIKFHGFFSTQGYPNKTHQYLYLNNYHVPNTSELYKVVSDIFSLSKFKSNLLVTKSKQRTKVTG
jgi:DNA mismatch repair protein MLH3